MTTALPARERCAIELHQAACYSVLRGMRAVVLQEMPLSGRVWFHPCPDETDKLNVTCTSRQSATCLRQLLGAEHCFVTWTDPHPDCYPGALEHCRI